MHTEVEIKIGSQSFRVDPGVVKGSALHSLAEIKPPQQLVVSRRGAMDVPIGLDDYVIIEGDEKFAIGDGDPPIVDNPCLRSGIKFSLNGEKFVGNDALDKAKLTGAEIKALVASGGPTDGLFAELKDFADEPIQDDWRIVVQDKDSFITVPCGNVGDQKVLAIQAFEHQLAELRQQYGQVDVVSSDQLRLVAIRGVVLPQGWNCDSVDLMIQVPQTYPPAALDMFWTFPHLKLLSGAWPQAGDQFEQHAGINWQRFSWHYTGNRWHPGRDSLSSHMRFCVVRLNQLW